MASESGTLYVGMTNDLIRRAYEHKNHLILGFTDRYGCCNLVYFETSNDVKVILEREKQIKRWNRDKKITLIKTQNPFLKDLSTTLEMTTEG